MNASCASIARRVELRSTRDPSAPVCRYERPARQLLLMPASPPACTYTMPLPVPFLLRDSRENCRRCRSRRRLEELVGGRQPLHLQPVVLVLAAQKRLIHQRRVVEIPRVLMLVVEIPDRRQEAAELWRDAVRAAV